MRQRRQMVTARQLSRFARLPARERRILLVAALVWLPGAWLGLRVLGLARLQRSLAPAAGHKARAPSLQEVNRWAVLVDTAALHGWVPSTCLTRSIALIWLLRGEGVEGRLRIGVRREQGRFEAHAWVEYRGQPVNDPHQMAAQFAPFADLLPSSAFQSQ